jgi:ABC-type uncharacterized transport system permease subunit
MTSMRQLSREAARQAKLPALAILVALFVGGVLMVASDPDAFLAFRQGQIGTGIRTGFSVVVDAYSAMIRSSLGSPRAIGETLVSTTPLLFAGLAFSVSFKAGLFNIGAEGQMLMGTLWAGWVGFHYSLPLAVHVPAALLAGMLGGALWGAIPGLLRARTGAHEVISTIMLNYIGLRVVDYALSTDAFLRPGRQDPISPPVKSSAELPGLIPDTRANVGILLALAAAWLVWWVLFRSTIGFELRAVGANPKAARYAGMSVTFAWVTATAFSGALAGLGGAVQLLGVNRSITSGFTGVGFDAIALALLGRTHPVGVILASLLFGIMRAGSVGMQAATSTPVDIITVIQAVVIALVAAPALIRALFRIKDDGVGQNVQIATSWGA